MTLLLVLLLSACPAPLEQPDDPDPSPTPDPTPLELEGLADDLDALRVEAGLPGAAACVTVEEGMWCAALGLADVPSQRPVEVSTPFLLASVTKSVTATAAMQEVELGTVDADADLSEALSWAVHPTHPEPITLDRLMTHQASILDNWDAMDDFYEIGRDPVISLEEAVVGYFDPSGPWYDADANFGSWSPGAAYEYSNMGVALEGLVIESVRGRSFDELVVERVLDPIGMEDSAWWLDDFGPDVLATPHESAANSFRPYPQFTFADYPNGGLRCSARDLARFGGAIARGGVWGGGRILEEGTVDTMLEEVVASDGVARGWFVAAELGSGWVGHDGGEDGTNTALYVHREDALSVVLLTNGDVDDWDAFDGMLAALVAAAEGA